MTEELYNEITQWQKETFPEATALSKIEHLKEELEELIVSVSFDCIGKELEFADCFFLLFGAAASEGMTYQDICNAIQQKFDINKARKWGKPNKKGVINHKK